MVHSRQQLARSACSHPHSTGFRCPNSFLFVLASESTPSEFFMATPSISSTTQAAETFLPFHRAAIGDEEIEAAVNVLRSGWITTGPRVKEIEQNFAART